MKTIFKWLVENIIIDRCIPPLFIVLGSLCFIWNPAIKDNITAQLLHAMIPIGAQVIMSIVLYIESLKLNKLTYSLMTLIAFIPLVYVVLTN